LDNKRKQKTKEMDVQGLLGAQTGKGKEVDEDRLRCFACGKVHGSSRLVRLPDGREVGSYSNEYRLFTEARDVLKRFKVKRTRQLHLAKVAEMRGQAGYEQLRNAMLEIYEREKNDLSE
jgi:hypothetical protein